MKKLFYKYLLIYSGLLAILILGSLFIAQMTKHLIWENLIEEETLNLEKGVLGFEKTLASIQSFSDHIATMDSIRIIREDKGELKIKNYVEMNEAKKQLSAFSLIGDLPYNFVLFQDNGVFLSKDQVFADFEKYYNSFMEADSLSASEFKELVFGMSDSVNYITFEKLHYFEGKNVTLENPLIVVIRPTLDSGKIAKNFCCVFVIPKEELLNYILTDINRDSTVVYIIDSTGKILIQHGVVFSEEMDVDLAEYKNKQDTYRFLNIRAENVTLNFKVGIAYSVVSQQAARLSKGISALLIISVVYTILTVLFLTWNRYKPTKQMLEYLADVTDEEIIASNELEYVEKSTHVIAERRTQLQNQLSDLKLEMDGVIMSKVLTQGIINEQDEDRVKRILPQHFEYYYVIIFYLDKINPDSLYEVSQCLINSFHEFYGEYLYALHSEYSETVFLVQQKGNETIDFDKMGSLLQNVVNQVIRQMDIVLSVGVSGIGSGIRYLNSAYEQAKQTYLYTRRENENTIGYYSRIKQEIGNESIEITSLFRIYDFILAGNKVAIERNISYLERICNKMADSQLNKEIFYSLSYIVYAAYEKFGFKENVGRHINWNAGSAFGSQLDELKKQMFLLIDNYENNKKSHNVDLKNDILRYIEENYMNVSLTALEVCEAMQISEKYLTQFLKEQTRKSFAKTLEEVRINKAKEYLLHTDWSNIIIAQKVGFGSINTFYRVFNKVEGISPTNWRKENRNEN